MTDRISLAYRDLTEIPVTLAADLAKTCKILDLTSNQISDLLPLRDIPELEELILDDNKITSHTKFPSLLRLQTLWVNRNQIVALSLFIDKLVASCPNLIMLSMLNNEACPNYFNSGTPAQYQDYRYYVINRMPKLQVLDSTSVTAAERAEAQKKYGNMGLSTYQNEASRLAAEKLALAKKRAVREARAMEKSDERVVAEKEERRRRRNAAKKQKALATPSRESKSSDTMVSPIASTIEFNAVLTALPDVDLDGALISNQVKEGVRILPPMISKDQNTTIKSGLGDISQVFALKNATDVEWDDDDDDDDDWSNSD